MSLVWVLLLVAEEKHFAIPWEEKQGTKVGQVKFSLNELITEVSSQYEMKNSVFLISDFICVTDFVFWSWSDNAHQKQAN